jgi:hypothetical protein
VAAALVVVSSAGPARAQVGVGVAYPGVPFLYYTPQTVPSPTDYLYDRDRARISAYATALPQQAAASAMAGAASSPNAYFNHIRDYSGEATYHVPSRQSLSRRSSPPPERPTSRSTVLPLDAYFLANGTMDWPCNSPDSASLHSARVEAEAAVKAVRDELKSSGKAKAQTVGNAKRKLVNYGQRALVEVKSAHSETVAVLFHYFLLFLDQSLDQASRTGSS